METVVFVRRILVEGYNGEPERFEQRTGGLLVAVDIPARQWYKVKALESGPEIQEKEKGAYAVDDNGFAKEASNGFKHLLAQLLQHGDVLGGR